MNDPNSGNLTLEQLSDFFERGKLYYRILEFDKALNTLTLIMNKSKSNQQWELYFEALIIIIRIHSERGEFQRIARLSVEALEICQKSSLVMPPKMHYVLGVFHYYQNEYAEAGSCFEAAAAQALQLELPRDYCFALVGLILMACLKKNFSLAFLYCKEAEKIILAEQYDDLQPYMNLTEIRVLLESGEFELAKRALDSLSMSHGYNGFIVILTLYYYGQFFEKTSCNEKAVTFYEMAQLIIDNRNLKVLSEQINQRLNFLRGLSNEEYDLKIVLGDRVEVTERDLGRVNIEGQSILIDFLKFLVDNRGAPADKERIVKYLWKVEYDPRIHDNKLYVTVRRLRSLIEPNIEKPIYLLRVRDGYLLNSSKKISIIEYKGVS